MNSNPTIGFLRLSQIVPDIVPIARSTWWKWCASGKAPAPIRLGPRTTVWRREEVLAFVEHGGV